MHYHHNFTGKKKEVQRGWVILSGSHSQQVTSFVLWLTEFVQCTNLFLCTKCTFWRNSAFKSLSPLSGFGRPQVAFYGHQTPEHFLGENPAHWNKANSTIRERMKTCYQRWMTSEDNWYLCCLSGQQIQDKNIQKTRQGLRGSEEGESIFHSSFFPSPSITFK